MDAKDFAIRLTERLRKRSAEYLKMAERKENSTEPPGKYALRYEILSDKTIAKSLDETADCIEETLETFDE